MTLGVVPSDRDVRTRCAASRNVDLETHYVIVCVGACCGRGGGRDNKVNIHVYLPSLMMKEPNHS
jgi:hypothetical protein